MPSYTNIRIERQGARAILSLARPEVRNALDEATLEELRDAFARLGRGGERVVLLKADGKDFCAGADVRWMRRAGEFSPAESRKDAMRLVKALKAVEECPCPVIARVHGGAYGGGLGLIAACDIVVAAEDSKFSFSECRLGILPAVVTSFVLPKIGPSHTRRLYLTAEVFGARTAQAVGLIHESVPEAGLDAKVSELAGSVLRNGPKAVAAAKSYIRKMAGLPAERRVKLSVETLVKSRSGPEGKEGLRAFLEKRPPSWLSGP